MNIAFISSEVTPFSKTGGLADVSGALPAELANLGVNIKVITPKYYSIDESKFGLQLARFDSDFKVRVNYKPQSLSVWRGNLPDSEVEVYFIDAPQYFNRHTIYTDDPDEDERFIFFQKAAIELIQQLQFRPDIIHCNDWQTGLIPLLIKENYSWDKLFADTKTILTLHNIGYQGRFEKSSMDKAEIRKEHWYPGGPVEFEGRFNFLKTGIVFADALSTVSEEYAGEITAMEYGAGLHEVLSGRKSELYGILNGIDQRVWNPWTDRFIHKRYSIKRLSGKLENKKELLERVNLPFSENTPVIGIISRMVYQKGFDILADSLPYLINLNVQFVVLGSGEKYIEKFFKDFSNENRDKIAAVIGYSESLAHIIEAGADIFLMPSRYEPCGLNQMYSLRYGTVPVVRKTGGLADTVKDWDEYYAKGYLNGNGFSFEEYSGFALSDAVERAVKYFADKELWRRIQTNGMSEDFSWNASARKYLKLYNKILNLR